MTEQRPRKNTMLGLWTAIGIAVGTAVGLVLGIAIGIGIDRTGWGT